MRYRLTYWLGKELGRKGFRTVDTYEEALECREYMIRSLFSKVEIEQIDATGKFIRRYDKPYISSTLYAG